MDVELSPERDFELTEGLCRYMRLNSTVDSKRPRAPFERVV
jgi:hypothetical protein